MSLLMDALKRAEENKQDAARRMTGTGRPAPDGLALEPLGAPEGLAPANKGPSAATLEAPVSRQIPEQPDAIDPLAVDENREAVRNAFAAKAPVGPQRPLKLLLGLLALAALAIGAYVWWELNRMGRSTLSPPSESARPLASPPPLPAAAPPSPAPAPPVAAVPPPPTPTSLPQRPLALETPAPGSGVPATPELPPPAAAAGTPVRIVKTRPEPDPAVMRAYGHLQGSALDAARQDYEQALRKDPRNLDALLGLAAIAQREGRAGDADRYHQQALEADPKDSAAQAAALSTAAAVDPAGAESRLKSLLASQPESAPLNFALGNLYSRQSRWGEAQAAYFNAVTTDGDNPDYLFNLAVSLDHLRQSRLAAQYYRQALGAADRRPAAFDRRQVDLRLRDLAPNER